MALRIYPIRPLRPRGYYGQGSPAAAFSGGEQMGKMAGGAMLEFQKWQAQQKQKQQQDQLNALANRMENTVTPPRAGLVAPGVNLQTGAPNVIRPGVPTAGTAPFSEGVPGMQLQQSFIRSQLENQKLAMELRNQGIASSLAARRGGGGGGGGNASRWQQYLGGGGKSGQVDQYGNPVKAGKPAPYQAGSSTVDNPTDYYNFNHQRIDVDAQYGKGTHDRLLAASGQLGPPDPKTGVRTTPDAKVDADGNVTHPPSMTVDKDGNVTLAPKGTYPGAYMPAEAVQQNMARNDATAVKGGGQPRFTDQYLKTQHPEAGLPGGDAANPYMPKTTLDLDAIAPGKSFVNPTDGKVYTKPPPGQPPSQQPPAKGTTQVDTGAQGQRLATGGQIGGQTQMPSLLQPPQGLAGGDQGQGQDYTGGGPQLSQLSPVVPQAPVDLAALSATNTPSSFNLGQPASGGLPQDQQLADEIKRTQMANYLQGVA